MILPSILFGVGVSSAVTVLFALYRSWITDISEWYNELPTSFANWCDNQIEDTLEWCSDESPILVVLVH